MMEVDGKSEHRHILVDNNGLKMKCERLLRLFAIDILGQLHWHGG
jgi:hypothetical protein